MSPGSSLNDDKNFLDGIRKAIQGDDLEALKTLLPAGERDADFLNSFLMLAAQNSAQRCAGYLIDQGAHLNADGTSLKTPLQAAAEKADLAMMEYLVSRGATAEEIQDINLVHRLLARDLDRGKKLTEFLVAQGMPRRVLSYALAYPSDIGSYRDSLEVVSWLLKLGADVRASDDLPLVNAILENEFGIAEFLMQKGADFPTAAKEILDTLLSCPGHDLEESRLAALDFLKQRGTAIDAEKSKPALKHAVRTQNKAALLWILDNATGATPDLLGDLLHRAALRRNQTALELLIARGAAVDHNEGAALVISVGLKNLEGVRALLDAGASTYHQDYDCVVLAAQLGQAEILARLLEQGIPPQDVLDRGLALSAFHGQTETLHLLLQHGADIGHDGEITLLMAIERRNVAMLKLLLEQGARPDKCKPDPVKAAQEANVPAAADLLNAWFRDKTRADLASLAESPLAQRGNTMAARWRRKSSQPKP